MAKHKPQVRFVVEMNGQLKRVLSVREGVRGDLLLTTHVKGLTNWNELGEGKTIKESRHSIHISGNSTSNTVHGVWVHEDKSERHHYLSTYALRSGGYQAIYVRSVAYPRHTPVLTLPAKGTVVPFPTYNPDVCTMYFAVWFCAPSQTDALLKGSPYSITGYRFKEFSILLPYCYVPEPSPEYAKVLIYETTTEERRSRRHLELGNTVGPVSGALNANAAQRFIIRDFNFLIGMPPDHVGLIPDRPLLAPVPPQFLSYPNRLRPCELR